MDDFCRKFYGGESNSTPKVVSYTFDDVVSAINEVAPYDWRAFFTERLTTHGPGAPLGGLENSGWKLVFTETMNEHQRAEETVNQEADVEYSLGMDVHATGGDESDRILDVIPGSPAAKAGLAPGMHLLAVNGRRWTPELLRDAIKRAKNQKEPIDLLAENSDYFKNYQVDYHGGERYPHLEAADGKTDELAEISRMRASAIPATPSN